jgi:hypothetical protein
VRDETPGEVTGEPSELVHRLIYLLDQEPPCDPSWAMSLGMFAGAKLGVMPRRADTRTSFLSRFVEHIGEILKLRVDEALLVRSARAGMDRWVASAGDVAAIDARRAEQKRYAEEALEDPLGIDRIRREMPHMTVGKTDDEVHVELVALVEWHGFQPLSADRVSQSWSIQEHYRAEVARWLDDDVIAEWERLRDGRRFAFGG